MGWVIVNHWDRRDTASREDFGAAAYAVCRAARGQRGITSAKYYWATADQIVIAYDTDDLPAFYGPPTKENGAAMFTMADRARMVGTETWVDAGQGSAVYKDAGR